MSKPTKWAVELSWYAYFVLMEYRWRACHFIAQSRRYRPFGWRKRVRWIDKYVD